MLMVIPRPQKDLGRSHQADIAGRRGTAWPRLDDLLAHSKSRERGSDQWSGAQVSRTCLAAAAVCGLTGISRLCCCWLSYLSRSIPCESGRGCVLTGLQESRAVRRRSSSSCFCASTVRPLWPFTGRASLPTMLRSPCPRGLRVRGRAQAVMCHCASGGWVTRVETVRARPDGNYTSAGGRIPDTPLTRRLRLRRSAYIDFGRGEVGL